MQMLVFPFFKVDKDEAAKQWPLSSEVEAKITNSEMKFPGRATKSEGTQTKSPSVGSATMKVI